MHVRSPDTDAVDALVDLWVDLAAEQRQYDSHVRAEANRTQIREFMLRHVVGDRVFVATDSDAIVGFVTFTVDTDPYEQDVTRGIVEHLYVHPDHRDEGIGTQLLRRAEDALTDRGVDVVSLQVMVDNDPARRFYRRHGFRPHRVELEKPVQSDNHSRENT